jgi:RES domain-containing protein
MDPKEVLNGRGAESYGGRFASIGTRAVFLAESDSAASDEVLARKRRLGSNAQITLDKYPRIVFGVAVSLERVLDLAKRGLPKALVSVRQSCLAPDDLAPLMELGDLLRARSVEGLVFPSAVGRGKNLIVYLEHCPAAALEVHNAAELMKKMRQIVRKPKMTPKPSPKGLRAVSCDFLSISLIKLAIRLRLRRDLFAERSLYRLRGGTWGSSFSAGFRWPVLSTTRYPEAVVRMLKSVQPKTGRMLKPTRNFTELRAEKAPNRPLRSSLLR